MENGAGEELREPVRSDRLERDERCGPGRVEWSEEPFQRGPKEGLLVKALRKDHVLFHQHLVKAFYILRPHSSIYPRLRRHIVVAEIGFRDPQRLPFVVCCPPPFSLAPNSHLLVQIAALLVAMCSSTSPPLLPPQGIRKGKRDGEGGGGGRREGGGEGGDIKNSIK